MRILNLEVFRSALIRKAFLSSFLNQGRRRCKNNEYFSHFMWNLYHPENKKLKGDGYCIHHKDKNTLNDSNQNLEKIESSEHNTIHHKGKIVSLETKRKMSENHADRSGSNNSMYGKKGKDHPAFGKYRSIEVRRKMSKAKSGSNHPMYGKHHSQETKKKMSESHKYLKNIKCLY
jgi:hypothetical protein